MGDFVNQASFASGEIGPHLYGRVDQELYYIGLRTARNFIIRQYGGASNRPGTRFISESKDSTRKTRLIPFQFNEIQTYCLEFGHLYMRIIKDGGEVLEPTKTITGITQAAQGVVTSNAHGYLDGEDIYIADIVGMVELNGRTLRVSDKTANTFKLKDFQGNYIDTSGFAAYSSGGTAARIYTVTTPWTEDVLFSLNYAQNKDVLTMVHQTIPIRDITRTAHDAWTISLFSPSEGPFKDINGTATTIYASAATGAGITLTASTALFTADDVGTLIYLEQSPEDATKAWEVQKGIRASEIRRAGFNYYQAPTAAPVTKNITAITAANPGVITSAAHGFTNGNVVYIDNIVGMTELNKTFWKVYGATATTFQLQPLNGGSPLSTSSGYTAYVSGGTIEAAYATGSTKPDWLEGSQVDGDPGVTWSYLHSGFGIAQITAQAGTTATATVIKRLPDNLVGAGGASVNWAKAAWSAAEGYPAAVSYYKQRMGFGGTPQQPNNLWFSKVGLRSVFTKSKPLLDDDAFTLAMDTTQVNAVRHLLPLSKLMALTSSSEQLITGKDNAFLATVLPSADVQGYNGSSVVRPLIIGSTALYVEDTGDVVRSLQYDLSSDTYSGIDLTARSPHLFEQREIVDWAYQKRPFSVVWTVMDNGALNGFTFMPEQKVYAWSRHDTDGEFESVCCIREGRETATYFSIKRTINGTVRRYTERLASRYFQNISDAYFVDCGLSYDGRNTTATTITISGGTTWDTPEVLTLTASASIFKATDVNNEIQFVSGKTVYKLLITGYTSGTVVLAIPQKALPAGYQNVARSDWQFARLIFRNFDHIEGKAVAVLADGAEMTDLTISGGSVQLPRPGAVVHIGLPYAADLETLDMAQPSGQTKAKTVNIPRVFVTVQETRHLSVATNGFDDNGNALTNKFTEAKQRNPENGYDLSTPAATRVFEVQTNSSWSQKGRICVRQAKPLPITVNCITEEVIFGLS